MASAVLLVVGLGLLLEPVAADLWTMWRNSQTVSTMTSTFDDANDPDRIEVLAQARAYNARLGGYVDPWLGGTGEDGDIEAPQRGARLPAVTDVKPWDEQLRYRSEDTTSWIEAPEANIRQVVYLGTDTQTLSSGAGVMEGTSLPVGGHSSRSVITGHSGMQNDRMFDDIRQLRVGDLFAVHTLGDTYTYEVESIGTYLPEEVPDHIQIEQGRDLCTLMTCTPYRINSHRLLVTGHRTDRQIQEPTAAESAANYVTNPRVVPLLVGVAIAASMLAGTILRRRRKRRRRVARQSAVSSTGPASGDRIAGGDTNPTSMDMTRAQGKERGDDHGHK